MAKINQSRSDVILDIIIYAVLSLITIIVLFPLIFVVCASISDPNAVYRGEVWLWPKGLNFDGYIRVFKNSEIWTGYINSLFYSAFFTFISLLATLPCAYALSRDDLRGGKQIMFFFTFTMFFGGGMIPFYLLVKSMGMLDSIWVLVLPGSLSVYNLIICRTFMKTNLPAELSEAAKIDGANDLNFFMSIVLPLSKPIIAVIGLFAAIQKWNDYFNPLMFINNRRLYPLQVFLREILLQTQMTDEMVGDMVEIARQQKLAESIKFSLIIVSSVPALILYPFVQKYFVKGIMVGAIKG